MTKGKPRIVLVIHNVRSAQNVGSMLRTAEGFMADEVFITGYSPYPETSPDSRLPHLRRRISAQIHKTALGAEHFMKWHYEPEITNCLIGLKQNGYMIAALEQTARAVELSDFSTDKDIALIVGNEVEGLEESVLNHAEKAVQISMAGKKESFNVAVAAGIALYHLRFISSRQKPR